jgi:hypothetical protein
MSAKASRIVWRLVPWPVLTKDPVKTSKGPIGIGLIFRLALTVGFVSKSVLWKGRSLPKNGPIFNEHPVYIKSLIDEIRLQEMGCGNPSCDRSNQITHLFHKIKTNPAILTDEKPSNEHLLS